MYTVEEIVKGMNYITAYVQRAAMSPEGDTQYKELKCPRSYAILYDRKDNQTSLTVPDIKEKLIRIYNNAAEKMTSEKTN